MAKARVSLVQKKRNPANPKGPNPVAVPAPMQALAPTASALSSTTPALSFSAAQIAALGSQPAVNGTASNPSQSQPSSGIPIPGLGGGVTVDDVLDTARKWREIFGEDKSTAAPGSTPDVNTQPGNNLPSPNPRYPQLDMMGGSGWMNFVAPIVVGLLVGLLAKSWIWGIVSAVLAFIGLKLFLKDTA